MGSSQVQGALWGVEARVWSETLEPINRALFEQVHDELTRSVLAAIGGRPPPPPPVAGGPFAVSAPGNLEALVEQIGLEPQGADEVAVDFLFASLDDAVRADLSAGRLAARSGTAGARRPPMPSARRWRAGSSAMAPPCSATPSAT